MLEWQWTGMPLLKLITCAYLARKTQRPQEKQLLACRQGFTTPRLLGQSNLSIAPAHKTRQHFATTMDPFRQFVGKNRVDILALVQAFDKRRILRSTAAHVERPADEGPVLVQVEGSLDHFGDALLKLAHVVGKKLLAICRGERD